MNLNIIPIEMINILLIKNHSKIAMKIRLIIMMMKIPKIKMNNRLSINSKDSKKRKNLSVLMNNN
jgi:hypothetical protein